MFKGRSDRSLSCGSLGCRSKGVLMGCSDRSLGCGSLGLLMGCSRRSVGSTCAMRSYEITSMFEVYVSEHHETSASIIFQNRYISDNRFVPIVYIYIIQACNLFNVHVV